MTPMEAWSIISANLRDLYIRQKRDGIQTNTQRNIEAEVITFQALKNMEHKEEQNR